MSEQNKRTVIVLNDYCHVNGGASKMAIDEAVGLAESGANVIFFGACGPVCEQLQNAPLEVVCLDQKELADAGKNPIVMLQGIWNVKAYTAMKDILARCDRDSTIVHLHGYTKAITTAPVRCAVKHAFSVVCTLHDFFPACPNGGYFDYQLNAPCVKKCLSFDCIKTNCDKRHYIHKLYRVVRGWGQRYLGLFPRHVKNYITLSENSARILMPYLPKDVSFYPLENLIEVRKEEPVNAAENKDIVVVGRLDPEKGIAVILEAAKRADVSLKFIGDGPLKPQALAQSGVDVTGWVTVQEVMQHLKTARALVFPSLWYETYGLVVSEAIALGIPVIVSDITAAAERITDGVQGWHFKSADCDDLVRCLEYTKDDEKIKKAGREAYSLFWENPPIREHHISALFDIYDTVSP